MLTVRELKELTKRLDVVALEQQLGPFVLIAHPMSTDANRAVSLATRPLIRPGAPAKSIFDFEELEVVTLPPLLGRGSFVLGRSPDCDLVINDDTVSKQHARIDWHGGAAEVKDLGAANAVFVNGVKVSGAQKLTDNDLITLGSAHLFFMVVSTLRRRMRLIPSGP